jgi:capsule polysaccharide modification protein KpsS
MDKINIKKKIIIFFSTDLADIKLANFLSKNNLKIYCYHTNLISYLIGIFLFEKNFITKKKKQDKIESIILEYAKKNFAYLSKRLNLKETIDCYYSTFKNLQKLNITNDKFIFLIPSGRHMHHLAAKRYAEAKKISSLYVNYSNIPGYIFFDPCGTDANSLLYKNIKILKKFKLKNKVSRIINKFKKIKEKQNKLPQTKNKYYLNIVNFAFYFENILQNLFNICSDRKIKKFFLLIKSNDFKIPYINRIMHKEFVFFPMQITTDIQVLVNYSKQSVFKAIEDAIKIASKKKLPLYIKENPAENSKLLVNKFLCKIKKKYPNKVFIIKDKTVFDLIKHCSLVITINSTVGLEAILNSKKIIFLGKSFYKKLTRNNLALYLNSYLLNFDYHNPKKIPNLIGKLNKIINLNKS